MSFLAARDLEGEASGASAFDVLQPPIGSPLLLPLQLIYEEASTSSYFPQNFYRGQVSLVTSFLGGPVLVLVLDLVVLLPSKVVQTSGDPPHIS